MNYDNTVKVIEDDKNDDTVNDLGIEYFFGHINLYSWNIIINDIIEQSTQNLIISKSNKKKSSKRKSSKN
jgi:hypothetical protein